ncbi:TPR-like protein [Hortaea werneckii]|nr:TPR-like protein [Hortaea werneckii]
MSSTRIARQAINGNGIPPISAPWAVKDIIYVGVVGIIMLAALLEWILWLLAFLYCLCKAFQKADGQQRWSTRILAVFNIVFFACMRCVFLPIMVVTLPLPSQVVQYFPVGAVEVFQWFAFWSFAGLLTVPWLFCVYQLVTHNVGRQRRIKTVLDEHSAPKVVVIMPCYNEEPDVLLRTIDSIVDCEYPPSCMHIFLSFDGDGVNELYLNTLEKLDVALTLKSYPKSIDIVYRCSRITVSRFPHGGKRGCQKRTFKLIDRVYADYLRRNDNLFLLFIDSDCILDRVCIQNFMYEMELKPGSKRNMLAMTGVITSTTIKNSIITVLQDMEYIHGQLFERTVESGCGAVTCLPGALTMLRFSAFRRMAKWYFADKAEQISDLFDWGKCHLGEDRWLTHLFMVGAREQYQIQMNTGAFCKTEAVQTFKSLLKQRRRWFFGFITNESRSRSEDSVSLHFGVPIRQPTVPDSRIALKRQHSAPPEIRKPTRAVPAKSSSTPATPRCAYRPSERYPHSPVRGIGISPLARKSFTRLASAPIDETVPMSAAEVIELERAAAARASLEAERRGRQRERVERYASGRRRPRKLSKQKPPEGKEPYISKLENGEYQALLETEEAAKLLGRSSDDVTKNTDGSDSLEWSDFIFQRLGNLLSDRSKAEGQAIYFCIGYAALLAFLQSNVTGPPLPFSSAALVLPSDVASDKHKTRALRNKLLASLSVDGIAAYKLTPNVELLCLADAVVTHPAVLKGVHPARWAKLRTEVCRQRLLSEPSSTLQNLIYDDLDMVEEQLGKLEGSFKEKAQVEFLLERAEVDTHHGLDKIARQNLDEAKQRRRFEYALTGLLGKRTKFQEKDFSQLVVLAKSASNDESGSTETSDAAPGPVEKEETGPAKLDLNDDTLLESISFSERPGDSQAPEGEESLPPALKALDPANQPKLEALDSITLLNFASSITNTSPANGLTREETLPYATRVLDGGSSNWQVYTQALLVRSRIEGPKESESASASERLRYIFQLASPYRWDLEAELAARWVQLGGLRSALEIYERLEMWAEAALCWAATEREDKAKNMIKKQLFHATSGKSDVEADDDETWEGEERQPPPMDAPRLYCILGDIDQDVSMYEKAWTVSKERYARAQRSLGRLYITKGDMVKAAEAYSKSLRVNQLNQQSWFALGCALLELAQFEKAVAAFGRCVQIDDTDAESWSNLAAALLRCEPDTDDGTKPGAAPADDEDESVITHREKPDPQRHRQDALKALKRAAGLKHDSYRIWENLLIVAASLSPPDYNSALAAQKRIIDIRGKTDGEKCIDKQILEMLASHVITTSDRYDPTQPGLPRIFVKFMDESVTPLITGSAELWQLVSKLALWRNKPSSALDAEEKSWRAVTAQPGWETENEKLWNLVVDATVRLCEAYESFGPMERTEGLASGEPVAKDWKFKARSALRGILGKAKGTWEGTDGWERLQETMQGLKA